MDKGSMQGIEHLLNKVSAALPEIRQKMAESFNVFRLCGINHYETWHSQIIADFLNPQGSHRLGPRFLNHFCEILRSLGFTGKFTSNTDIHTEFTGHIQDESIGRFDLLLEDSSTHSVCLIENKIFAGEQPEQLQRYAEWLQSERKDWKRILVFLTLDGREAWSIEDQRQYQRLAYVAKNGKKDLVGWIDSCLSENNPPFVQSTLEQYKEHIKDLAKGEQAMNEAVVKMLKGNMQSAEQIYNSFYDARRVFIAEFMEKYILDILRKKDPNWVIYKNDLTHSKWPSFAFSLSNAEKNIPIWVFVNNEFEECEVGLYSWDLDSKFIELIKKKDELKELPNGWAYDEEWVLWKPVHFDNASPKLGISWDSEFLDRIATVDSYRNAIASIIADLIMDLQDIINSFCSLKKQIGTKRE